MSCRYCQQEVVWVPTCESVRPFDPPSSLSSDSPVVVMKAHACEARLEFLASKRKEFMQGLYQDPEIRAAALSLPCPTCNAEEGQPCRDLRPRQRRLNKNPHLDRLIAGARALHVDA